MSKKELIVVGELNVDLILNNIDGFPKIGTEIIADDMNLTLGSSSAIMAANAAAMGVNTSFCGKIGKDMFGDIVLKELNAKQVSTNYISTSETHQTGITIVMNYDEDRANVTYCGAMELLTIDDIPWEELTEFKHFHLSNFFIQKGIRKDITLIFKKAKEAGLTTSLDLQWDPENQWDFNYEECLPYVDVFMPNEAEIKALTGTSSIEEALEKVTPYANTIALKMGAKGSIGIKEGTKLEITSFSNPNHVDSIGAGDSFNSGFIKQYIAGKSLEECLSHGNLMGALNTTAPGGTGAFKNPEEIKQKVKSIFNVAI
ncbi:Sugar or nucleoside kinase, ribokinase family [Zhouia amylolytica]|uniref:Sugar kinase, ribokinase n=2 Tax=Zhouia amylolytica TaxID=376730 RepID=W2UN52_9FLAO|nr:carbohydrate kinase family protein [Zhouia amylolytica]ETN94901.1 sugar kinase, ribokinase [Zhouia amylolytica AD3]SFS66246.1 Sugar or nucleoside kinase, ribokinase family [Zhouia amylolytica]